MSKLSKSTTNRRIWEERYQQGLTGWDRGEVSPNLQYWVEAQHLSPCRILVPGCGNGHEVIYLIEKGFDVVAIDIASSPIENLTKKLEIKQLKAELIQADFFHWQPDKSFDAIYEQTSLCALSPGEWQGYEHCLYDWLKPTGKIFAQFMQTEREGGPPFHCEITAMADLFMKRRWLWSKQYETQVFHPKGLYEKLYLLEKVL